MSLHRGVETFVEAVEALKIHKYPETGMEDAGNPSPAPANFAGRWVSKIIIVLRGGPCTNEGVQNDLFDEARGGCSGQIWRLE